MSDTDTIRIHVKISTVPPSANRMRKHFIRDGKVRSVKDDAYKAWKESAAWELRSQFKQKIIGPYRLHIHVQRDWGPKRARDIDNTIKPVSDAVVAAGLVEDDSLCEAVSAKWSDDVEGVLVILETAERKS